MLLKKKPKLLAVKTSFFTNFDEVLCAFPLSLTEFHDIIFKKKTKLLAVNKTLTQTNNHLGVHDIHCEGQKLKPTFANSLRFVKKSPCDAKIDGRTAALTFSLRFPILP